MGLYPHYDCLIYLVDFVSVIAADADGAFEKHLIRQN